MRRMALAKLILRALRVKKIKRIVKMQRALSIKAALKESNAFPGEKSAWNFDFAVVGGGLVGLATALEMLLRYPHLKLALLEKESELACHQSGRHPGLLHSGVFSQPENESNDMCVRGSAMMEEYCVKKCIHIDRVGKMIVATNDAEDQTLEDIICNAAYNGIKDIKILNGKCAIRDIEPYVVGLRALFLPYVGAINWKLVASALATDILCRGGVILKGLEAEAFIPNDSCSPCDNKRFPVSIIGDEVRLNASHVVVCTGVFVDRMAYAVGCKKAPMVFPMRANYFRFKFGLDYLFKGNVYPVPKNLNFPFLEPCVTRRYDGTVVLGPNIIPASKKEGYKATDVSFRDMGEMVRYRGFWRLRPRQWSTGYRAVRAQLCLDRQVKRFKHFAPCLRREDIVPHETSIIYPQVVDVCGTVQNELLMEYCPTCGNTPELGKRILFVRNLPYPAATSCLAIAKAIVQKVHIDLFGNRV